QSGLDKRIPLRGTNDEWDRVAENLNLMLDRIETLMGEVKQVSDNVAHDLRTPLTRMRGRLEKAYHGQRISDDDQSLIGDTIADDGPGIPAGEHEHVFKRFYRIEHSRYTPGNGLGLSLVAAVARLHGARIEMLDNAPGLKLKLWFSAPTS